MIGILKNIPSKFDGPIVNRENQCNICGESKGIKIGKVDYWDIKTCNIIKCEKCGLAQLDPMLSHEETAKGCLAYYIEETLRVSAKEEEKNLYRNFRRGVLFASTLKKKNIYPYSILEIGPGSGYFCEGIKFIFPNIEVTVLDVNEEILDFNIQHHNYKAIHTTLEEFKPEFENSFDLVIARDIIEHVIDFNSVVKNIAKYLKNDGYFHFITPNGQEDVWKHYVTDKLTGNKSELLINHVNYFEGKGLLEFLTKQNFSKVLYYNYKLKGTKKGKGRKVVSKLMAPISIKKSSQHFLDRLKEIQNKPFSKKEVLNKWYINKKTKTLAILISKHHHDNTIKLNPKHNVGHEVFGLFRLTK